MPAMTGFMEGDRGSERKPRKTECAIEGSSYPGGRGAGCRGCGHDWTRAGAGLGGELSLTVPLVASCSGGHLDWSRWPGRIPPEVF